MFNPCWSYILACCAASACQEPVSRLLSSFCPWYRLLLLAIDYCVAGVGMDLPDVQTTANVCKSWTSVFYASTEQIACCDTKPDAEFCSRPLLFSCQRHFQSLCCIYHIQVMWWIFKNVILISFDLILMFIFVDDGGRHQSVNTTGIQIAQNQYFEKYSCNQYWYFYKWQRCFTGM